MEKDIPVAITLQKMNVPHQVFEHKTPLNSIEQAAAERGQGVTQVIRSILFRVGKEEFVLVLAAGPGQLSWPALRAHLGQSRMTIATKDEVLRVTGYPIGTVAPIGFPQPIRLIADKNIFAHEEISFGSGKPNTAIIMKRKDFEGILGDVEIGELLTEGSR